MIDGQIPVEPSIDGESHETFRAFYTDFDALMEKYGTRIEAVFIGLTYRRDGSHDADDVCIHTCSQWVDDGSPAWRRSIAKSVSAEIGKTIDEFANGGEPIAKA